MIALPKPSHKPPKPLPTTIAISGSALSPYPSIDSKRFRININPPKPNDKQMPTHVNMVKFGNKKTEDSQTHFSQCGSHEAPKSHHAIQQMRLKILQCNKMGAQGNAFKIRQLSSQGKRFKENIHPNSNYNSNSNSQSNQLQLSNKSMQLLSHRSHSINEFNQFQELTELGTDQIKQQTVWQIDRLMDNHMQDQLSQIENQTIIQKLLSKEQKNIKTPFAIIVSQCLLQEAIGSQVGIARLKQLCRWLCKNDDGIIIAVKVSGKGEKQIGELVGQLRTQKVKIRYVIGNGERFASEIQILDISQMANSHNIQYVIAIDDMYSNQTSMYATLNNTVQYGYFNLNGWEGVNKFAQTFQMHKTGHVQYHKSSYAINNTKTIHNSAKIKQMIKLKLSNIALTQQIKCVKNRYKFINRQDKSNDVKTRSSEQLLGESTYPHYEETYKNKLVQLIKALQIQSRSTANILNYKNNSNTSNYIKINLPKAIIQPTVSYVPANTAYQIAAELINSNIHNYKQINEFRERMSNASQPN